MKNKRPLFPMPGTPEAEVCRFLPWFAVIWLVTTLIMITLATWKA